MPTLCLRCTRSFLGVAWRSSSVSFLLVLPQFWLAWFLSSSSIAFSLGSVKVFSGRSGFCYCCSSLFLLWFVLCWRVFWLSSVMPRPSRSTNNSLSAGLPTEDSLPSTATSESPASSTASSSWSPQLADSLTEAVVRAIGNSIPAIISSIQRTPPRRLLPPFQAFLLAGLHNLYFLQRLFRVRVQVSVFLRWLQVRLPFPRLFLRLRQCRPLPSRARPAP